MADPASLAPEFLLLALIAALVGVRTVRMMRGAPVSGARLVGFGLLYVVLFASVLLVDVALLPWYSYALDAVAIVAAIAVAVPYVGRRVVLERRPDGQWVYRLGALLPVVYLVLFLVRILVDLLLVGASPFGGPTGSGGSVVLSPTAAGALIAVDALFSFSAGLLLGRNVAVYVAYRRRLRGGPAAPPPDRPAGS